MADLILTQGIDSGYAWPMLDGATPADLTGFTADHGGTAFEVRSAFDLVDVARLKLTASHSSDTRFLNAQLQHAWSQLAADSPNAGTGVREVTVYVG